jgi:ADYC domain-containing protein
MTGYDAKWIFVLCLSACTPDVAERAVQQPYMTPQSNTLQGIVLHGTQTQGMTMQGFRFAGATLGGAALGNFQLENGELMGEQNGVTVRGTALVNAHLFAELQNKNVHPPANAVVEYRITGIVPEDAVNDPTQTGATFLYTLEENVDGAGSWQAACPVDHDGRRVAIPLADVWDDNGNRNSSAPLFTLGCTTGSIAGCYRLGYRPWITGFGNLKITHWTCTRLERADYCGDGVSHTIDGTLINLWDNLGAPGPIRAQGTTPPGMSFEAAWDQNGALCFSHARWTLGGEVAAAACPNKLKPPRNNQPGTVCDNALQGGGNSRMFNESALH